MTLRLRKQELPKSCHVLIHVKSRLNFYCCIIKLVKFP